MSEPASPTTSGADPAPSSDRGSPTISSAVFIPIVVVIVGIFVLGLAVVLRHRIISLFRKIFGLPPLPAQPALGRAENGQAPGQISAEQLAGTAPTTTTTASGATPATTTAGGRGRRARRGVRRTDSGTSIRTLPVYSKEAGDEELVLVRRQSMGSVDETDETEEGDNEVMEMRERRTSLSGVLDRVASIRRSGSIRSIASAMSRRSTRPLSDIASSPPNTETIPEQRPATPQSAPPRIRQLSQTNSVRSRAWGEAPTYLEAMSSPLPEAHNPTDEQTDEPPARTTLRERTSSTFLSLLSRTGLVPGPSLGNYTDPYLTGRSRNPPNSRNNTSNRRPSSSVSLLLQPQTSRLSGRSFDPTTSAYPSPWTSTHSLGLISPPVLNSAVRASFETNDLPRAGLSEDQMRFLGTKEATSLAGVRVGDVPPGKRRRGSVLGPSSRNVSGASGTSGMSGSSGEEASLPTWDEVDGERRRAEAEQGRGRADVLLAGGVEVGSITVEPGTGEGTSTSGAESQGSTSRHSASSTTAPSTSTSTPIPIASGTPAAPPRLDVVAPTPTSPNFPTPIPIVTGPVLGM